MEESGKSIEYKDTIRFVPPVEIGRVIKVYDGDTITIAAKLPFGNGPLYRFSVRIRGIDCAEMRSRVKAEKRMAFLAKKKLANICLDKEVTLRNVDLDKYGRLLADVTCEVDEETVNLGETLLNEGLAVVYNGGKRKGVDWNSMLAKQECATDATAVEDHRHF